MQLNFSKEELIGAAAFIDYVGKDDPEGYQFEHAAKNMRKVTPDLHEDRCLLEILSFVSKLMLAAADVCKTDPQIKMELAATQAFNDQLKKELEDAGK